MQNYSIRPAALRDIPLIEQLYKRVAAIEGGLARTATEITSEYVNHFVTKSLQNGLEIVAVENTSNKVIGEIHCYNSGVKVFEHILGDLTIAVDPEYQGKGIGKKLFTHLLDEVQTHRTDILRIELLARESNAHALKFYESLGFKQEGRLKNRIRSVGGGYEDDIFMAWYR